MDHETRRNVIKYGIAGATGTLFGGAATLAGTVGDNTAPAVIKQANQELEKTLKNQDIEKVNEVLRKPSINVGQNFLNDNEVGYTDAAEFEQVVNAELSRNYRDINSIQSVGDVKSWKSDLRTAAAEIDTVYLAMGGLNLDESTQDIDDPQFVEYTKKFDGLDELLSLNDKQVKMSIGSDQLVNAAQQGLPEGSDIYPSNIHDQLRNDDGSINQDVYDSVRDEIAGSYQVEVNPDDWIE